MRRERAFRSASWRRVDKILERLPSRYPSETTSFPPTQIVLHSPFAWLAEEAPRLPARFRHHGYFWELVMGILGSIAATKRVDQTNDFPTTLESRFDERRIDKM